MRTGLITTPKPFTCKRKPHKPQAYAAISLHLKTLPHLSPIPSGHPVCLRTIPSVPPPPLAAQSYKEGESRRIWNTDAYLKPYTQKKQKGQLHARKLFLMLLRCSSCQMKKNMKLLNEMQKDDTVWLLLSICMWTGLACLGWLKQCRSNLGVCTSEHSSKPGQPNQPQQNPAKGKAVPPEGAKTTARTLCQNPAPACSGHPQHLGSHWHFHTLLCSWLSPAKGGRQALLRLEKVTAAAWCTSSSWAKHCMSHGHGEVGFPCSVKPASAGIGRLYSTKWKTRFKEAKPCPWCQQYSAGWRCRECGTCSHDSLPGQAAFLLEGKSGVTAVAIGLLQQTHINLVQNSMFWLFEQQMAFVTCPNTLTLVTRR